MEIYYTQDPNNFDEWQCNYCHPGARKNGSGYTNLVAHTLGKLVTKSDKKRQKVTKTAPIFCHSLPCNSVFVKSNNAQNLNLSYDFYKAQNLNLTYQFII